MSTVMTTNEAAPAPHHRRSREEVEALAKNFVATPVEEAAAPVKSRLPLLASAGGAVVVIAVVAFVALSGGEPAPEAARPAAEQSRAAAEAEAMRQRYEAERERKRKELAASSEYMEKMAAADAQLVKDMSSQAEVLSRRAAAQPAAGDGVPTPRDATAKSAPAPTSVASAPQKSTAAAAPAPQPEAAKPAPAAPAATQVAQAAPSSCSIHVSELSKSGKLTYADVAKMKGARLDETTGNVFTPPVQVAGNRTVVFEVMPTGCVRLVRR